MIPTRQDTKQRVKGFDLGGKRGWISEDIKSVMLLLNPLYVVSFRFSKFIEPIKSSFNAFLTGLTKDTDETVVNYQINPSITAAGVCFRATT